jgi:hypothetical protein
MKKTPHELGFYAVRVVAAVGLIMVILVIYSFVSDATDEDGRLNRVACVGSNGIYEDSLYPDKPSVVIPNDPACMNGGQ